MKSIQKQFSAAVTKKRSLPFFVGVLLIVAVAGSIVVVSAFQPSRSHVRSLNIHNRKPFRRVTTQLCMAQASEQDAKKAIDTVVKALRSDSAANQELGKLNKVENVLGYGMPQKGRLAVRFNASFQKGGRGFLGFGTLGGGGNKTEKGQKPDNQRGTMVGQVKASVDPSTGKVLECSVFRDLGYGRSFNLKTR